MELVLLVLADTLLELLGRLLVVLEEFALDETEVAAPGKHWE